MLCSCYGVVEEGRNVTRCGLWRVQEEEEGPLHALTTLNHDGGNFRWLVYFS